MTSTRGVADAARDITATCNAGRVCALGAFACASGGGSPRPDNHDRAAGVLGEVLADRPEE
jgi:hypothetical protein